MHTFLDLFGLAINRTQLVRLLFLRLLSSIVLSMLYLHFSFAQYLQCVDYRDIRKKNANNNVTEIFTSAVCHLVLFSLGNGFGNSFNFVLNSLSFCFTFVDLHGFVGSDRG